MLELLRCVFLFFLRVFDALGFGVLGVVGLMRVWDCWDVGCFFLFRFSLCFCFVYMLLSC